MLMYFQGGARKGKKYEIIAFNKLKFPYLIDLLFDQYFWEWSLYYITLQFIMYF